MASEGLISIKRRIKSINNTKKITKAVGLVATSKLKKTKERLIANNDYYDSLKRIMAKVLSDNEVNRDLYFHNKGGNKKLYIALTSDTGLCGGFNGNVVDKTLEIINESKENSHLIIVGQKGIGYFKRFKIDSIAEYTEIPDIPTIKEVKGIINKAEELYFKGEVDEVNMVYTKFVSTVKQQVELIRVLPIDKKSIGSDDTLEESIIEFEPEKSEIVPGVCKLYLSQTFLNAMLNSKASEQTSRMLAMEGATKNADDLLYKLKIQYNRIRQTTITQEISEIVGGAEVQK